MAARHRASEHMLERHRASEHMLERHRACEHMLEPTSSAAQQQPRLLPAGWC